MEHPAEWETILVNDGPCPPDALVVYRALTDADADDVVRAGGFTFLNDSRIYAASMGGLYFSTTINDVFHHARQRNNGRHYFQCWVPAPTRRITLTDDNSRELPRTFMTHDTLVHNVDYPDRYVTEYVKAGRQGAMFRPFKMYLVRKRVG